MERADPRARAYFVERWVEWLLGLATGSALALAGVIVLVAAWTILPAALARRRGDQGTTPPPAEPTDLFTDADCTLPPLTERRHRARRYMR